MYGISQRHAQAGGEFNPQEARFFELSIDLLCLIDHEGIVRHLNSAVERILGYCPVEIIGRSFLDYVHQEDRRRALLEFGQIKSGQDSRAFECRVRRKDDLYVWLSCSCTAPPDGEPLIFAVCRDVTRRKEAEEAHRAAEHRLQQILDNTSAVIYVKQLDGRYLLVNRRFELLFNVTREQVLSMTDEDLFPKEMAEAFRANDQRVAETGEVLTLEEVAPHPDGAHTYVSVKFPLRDASGHLCAVAGISTDITQRARAEETLAATKSRLEMILNAISDGVIGIGPTGEIAFLNTAAEQLLDEDSCAHGASPNPDTRNLIDSLQDVELENGRGSRQIELQRGDGSSIHLQCTVQSALKQGQFAGTVITLQDVSAQHERRILELDMQSAQIVQRTLLPNQPPQMTGLEIAGAVYPASLLCGDYLDFIRHSEDEISTVIADVTGHGFGPAMQMVDARSYLRAILESESCPAAALQRLNQYLMRDLVEGSFTTMFLARWNATQRQLTYAAGGHEAWLLQHDGTLQSLQTTGLVLGVDADASFQRVGPLKINCGDVLLLVTDGVFETMSAGRELYGWPRTLTAAQALRHKSAAEIVDGLYQETRDFAGNQHQADDVAIGIVKVL